ncbi:hypothetical protein HNQ60_002073 [Povalibacter uvarum]|uniref:Uncharacterized protein n=1 Tax=Povalibacter uvarum TaxID=732238 RepID=A0A841HML2_9GAMM|nr:hypothetical protein [Povalibacter uvarum]MBB6093195.1 hypothetical protein [Povalibacter uvarum]
MKRIAAIGAALIVTACAQSPSKADAPAVIVEASAQSRAELLSTVQKALGVSSITLADDALTQSSTLFVERASDAGGRPLDGRNLGRPERFDLIKSADHCVLIYERTGERHELTSTRCHPTG